MAQPTTSKKNSLQQFRAFVWFTCRNVMVLVLSVIGIVTAITIVQLSILLSQANVNLSPFNKRPLTGEEVTASIGLWILIAWSGVAVLLAVAYGLTEFGVEVCRLTQTPRRAAMLRRPSGGTTSKEEEKQESEINADEDETETHSNDEEKPVSAEHVSLTFPSVYRSHLPPSFSYYSSAFSSTSTADAEKSE